MGQEKEKQKGGEKARTGRNDGILSDLNCGVKGCAGSVNSNQSHILFLYFRRASEFWT